MQEIPTIGSVMTPSPMAVSVHDSLRSAHTLMIDHAIRHLPVLQDGELVGVLSDRDVAALDSDADSDRLLEQAQVLDACTLDIYTVEPDEGLDVVLGEMAARRIGSVVVARDGKVHGLFTVTDACRCFAAFLRGEDPTDAHAGDA